MYYICMYQKRMSATNIALRACKRFFVRRQIKRTSKTQQFVRGTWQSEQFPKDMLSCVVLCFLLCVLCSIGEMW